MNHSILVEFQEETFDVWFVVGISLCHRITQITVLLATNSTISSFWKLYITNVTKGNQRL
jgi:hypothetical protein